MRLGYAVMNRTLGITTGKSFRLASYTPERFHETVRANIEAFETILKWNVDHDILYYRVSTDLIPFASHPVQTEDWQVIYADDFARIGTYIKENDIRLANHAGPFTVMSSPNPVVATASITELEYHADVFDLLGLDVSHKLQLHLGGVFGDPEASLARCISTYQELPEKVKRRLVIEHEERSFGFPEVMKMHAATGVPVIFDTLHHQVRDNGRDFWEDFDEAASTWKDRDGIQLVDFSTQDPDKKPGAHALTLDESAFKEFIHELGARNVDIMFEVKDKDISVLKALAWNRAK
jgi:UV DNA damage endonuclease